MKVRELIEVLGNIPDQDAEVLVMTQSSYPLEYRLAGVAVREDFADIDEEETHDGETGQPASRSRAGEEATDVFLVEGSQIRYGSPRAWDALRK